MWQQQLKLSTICTIDFWPLFRPNWSLCPHIKLTIGLAWLKTVVQILAEYKNNERNVNYNCAPHIKHELCYNDIMWRLRLRNIKWAVTARQQRAKHETEKRPNQNKSKIQITIFEQSQWKCVPSTARLINAFHPDLHKFPCCLLRSHLNESPKI